MTVIYIGMYYLSWKKKLIFLLCMFVSHLFYDSLDSSKTQLSWTFVIVIKKIRFNVCSLNVHCNFLSHLRRWLILHLKFLGNLIKIIVRIHVLKEKNHYHFHLLSLLFLEYSHSLIIIHSLLQRLFEKNDYEA